MNTGYGLAEHRQEHDLETQSKETRLGVWELHATYDPLQEGLDKEPYV